MCLAAQRGWASRQVDFSNAYVQADLEEDIYIEMPAYFTDSTDPGKHLVLKLDKSLYGLVQAPKKWADYLEKGLIRRGFNWSKSDPGLYIGREWQSWCMWMTASSLVQKEKTLMR